MHLFIDPGHQGCGLGPLLLAEAESILRAGGYEHAELHTTVGNAPAIALYQSAGWIVTDDLVHSAHGGVDYDEHVLVKQLG